MSETYSSGSKIRVVHVLHAFGFGGLEKGIATVIRHGSPAFEHVILCLARTGESESLVPEGTKVIELHKKAGSSLRFLLKIARELRVLKPAVIHTRNWGGMDGIIAANIAGMGRRVVQGEHGWGMEDAYGQSTKRIWVRRFLSLGVKEFTCVSRQIEAWLQKQVKVFCPVTQIYNGIDTSRFSSYGNRKELHQELELDSSTKLIACVGRLDPIKDHAGLIKAFAQVRRAFPDTALLIVGDGPERDRLAGMHVPGVYFLGARYDIPDILRTVDIFALASLNEGISNTILEAMSSGLPVVSTEVGGTPELITHEHNGLLAPPEDIDMIASHLRTYLQFEEMCVEHGRRNRRISEERFSVQGMVKSYEQVWKRVAGE